MATTQDELKLKEQIRERDGNMTKPKKKPPSGGARLTAAGKTPVLLGLLPEQRETLLAAAAAECRPLTQFLIFHGLEAAKKILKKSDNSG